MGSYWHTPPQFNPSLAYQHQALLNMLAHHLSTFQPQPQPSWHTPGLVSPQTYMQGLTPTLQPPHFLGLPAHFAPPTTNSLGFPGLPIRLGPNTGGTA